MNIVCNVEFYFRTSHTRTKKYGKC